GTRFAAGRNGRAFGRCDFAALWTITALAAASTAIVAAPVGAALALCATAAATTPAPAAFTTLDALTPPLAAARTGLTILARGIVTGWLYRCGWRDRFGFGATAE